MAPRKSLSLDTNLILDLADESDWAHEFREVFSERGYSFTMVPRVGIELVWHAAKGAPQPQRLARIAISRLAGWRINPALLSDTQRAIAKEFGRRLIRSRLIPATELNDGIILGESALLELPLVVTNDKHLLGIDDPALRIAFDDADLPTAIPVSPRRLLRALRG